MTHGEIIAAVAAAEEFLKPLYLDVVNGFARVGSSIYMPPEKVNDVDYVVLLAPPKIDDDLHLDNSLGEHFLSNGFSRCGDYDVDGNWEAVRRGHVNFMVTTSKDFYRDYIKAMELSKALNLQTKYERIIACRVIRDGKTAEEAIAEADKYEGQA